MEAAGPVKIILENLAESAKAVSPGGGRGAPIKADAATARALLTAFAALPADEAEDADARILLFPASRRLVVRFSGGRLILEEADAFSYTTVDAIAVQLAEAPPAPATPQLEEPLLDPVVRPAKAADQVKIWLLALLVVGLAAIWWSTNSSSDVPAGVELERTDQGIQEFFDKATGIYSGDAGTLTLLGSKAHLVLKDKGGTVVYKSTVRVGRSGHNPVLITKDGTLATFAPDGSVEYGGIVYTKGGSTP